MNKCLESLPSERLRVFISSAQSNEGDFCWKIIRHNIKESLSKCMFFNPFIIEDEASSMPSTQFFLRQVEKADVIVLLIKGEIRDGTFKEISLANKKNKPLFVYFYEDNNPNEKVTEFKQSIERLDRCTYKNVSENDCIEEMVRSDLMNTLVRTFQDKEYYSYASEQTVNVNYPRDAAPLVSGTPSKTDLAKFDSCYSHLLDLLNYSHFEKEKEKSELHDFGCLLIDWLTTGRWNISEKDINKIIDSFDGVYINFKCLEYRWDAIFQAQKGNLKAAIDYEKDALEIAKNSNEPSWIINSILVDCRNLEISYAYKEHLIVINSAFQEEIKNQDQMINMPVLDRFLTNIYEQTNTDKFRKDTVTKGTMFFGSGFEIALQNMANYLFVAAIYGSYTHIQISRDVFAGLLTQYSDINNDSPLAYEALKQHVFNGKSKEYRAFLNSKWDIFYSFIGANADELWNLSDLTPIQSQEPIKIMVFLSTGMYMSDSCFFKAESYMYGLIESIDIFNIEIYLEAIEKNLNRMNQESVLKAIIYLLNNQKYPLATKISHIILNVNYESVSRETMELLSGVLKEQLPTIIERNGDPQMIVPLVERDRDLFGYLETVSGNGLEGTQKLLYQINMGEDKWLEVLRKMIQEARYQFEKNSKAGVYYGFALNPYFMISKIIKQKKENSQMIEILQKNFIPLAIEVIKSNAAVQTKEICISTLIDVLCVFNNKKVRITEELRISIEKMDINNGMDYSIYSSNRKDLEIRVLMIKVLCGIIDMKALQKWCVSFNLYSSSERISLIDCLEKYLSQDINNVDSLILYIVLQCAFDKNAEVRVGAYKCLAYIAMHSRDIEVINTLYKGIYDPASSVRATILHICEEQKLPEDLSIVFIESFCNDANYIIRNRALKLNNNEG